MTVGDDFLDLLQWLTEPEQPADAAVPTSIYRLFNEAGELLYVGITHRRYYRLHEHAATKPWWDEVATATFQHVLTRRAAIDAETKAIADENPRYNVVRPRVYPTPPKPTERRVKGVYHPNHDRERGSLLEPEELMALLDRQTKRVFKMTAPAFIQAWENGQIDRTDERLRDVVNLLAQVRIPLDDAHV
jgi:hypothetical protein